MTAQLIEIPTKKQISAAIFAASHALKQWASLCNRQIEFYLSWAFPAGIPGDIGDAWYEFCTSTEWDCWRESGTLDWNEVFRRFADAHLASHPEYRLVVDTLNEERVS